MFKRTLRELAARREKLESKDLLTSLRNRVPSEGPWAGRARNLALWLLQEPQADSSSEAPDEELVSDDHNVLAFAFDSMMNEVRDMELELEATERARKEVLEQNFDALLVTDATGAVLYMNPPAMRLLGEECGTLDKTLFTRANEDPSAETTIEHPSGGTRIVQARAMDLIWSGAQAHLISIHDITHQRHAEDLQKRLAHADRLSAVGRIAAGVAHEINNPTAFITGNNQALHQLFDNLSNIISTLCANQAGCANGSARDDLLRTIAEVRELVSENEDGLLRITRLVRELNGFARSDNDYAELARVEDAARAACTMTRTGLRTHAKVVAQFETTRPIACKPGKLTQAVVNLLVNAGHATQDQPGDQQITVSVTSDEHGVLVRVTDTGKGIPADALDRVMKPFYTTKPAGKGTGLGLSLVHEIVLQHSGTMEIRSAVGKGTTVQFHLPWQTGLSAPQAPSPPPALVESSGRARILLIDDEVTLLKALRRRLARQHDVTTANGAGKALDVFAQDRAFDLVLCDFMMPEMDGVELYHHVRESWPDLADRFVFCTGGAVTQRSRDFREATENTVISKPEIWSALDGLVAKHLQMGRISPTS